MQTRATTSKGKKKTSAAPSIVRGCSSRVNIHDICNFCPAARTLRAAHSTDLAQLQVLARHEEHRSRIIPANDTERILRIAA